MSTRAKARKKVDLKGIVQDVANPPRSRRLAHHKLLQDWRAQLKEIVNKEAQIGLSKVDGSPVPVLPPTLVKVCWRANLKQMVYEVLQEVGPGNAVMVRSRVLGMMKEEIEAMIGNMETFGAVVANEQQKQQLTVQVDKDGNQQAFLDGKPVSLDDLPVDQKKLGEQIKNAIVARGQSNENEDRSNDSADGSGVLSPDGVPQHPTPEVGGEDKGLG